MRVRVEFTTEPFHPSHDAQHLPEHVTAAAAPFEAAGLGPDLGPLGTSVAGEEQDVVPAMADGLRAALAAGATRVTITVQTTGTEFDAPESDAESAAASKTEPAPRARHKVKAAAKNSDKATDLSGGLTRLIAEVEEELGGDLASLPRAQKQHAVALLEERGAFEMRKSAETVAEAMGLSRFTVYNYLNRLRESQQS